MESALAVHALSTALSSKSADPSAGATPWWLTLVVGLIALAGTVFSAVLVRRTGKESNVIARLDQLNQRIEAMELDKWRHREETMRMLRWASEKAVDEIEKVRILGIAALAALGVSELLQAEDEAFIDSVIDAILREPVAEYHEEAEGGEDVEVVQDDSE
jgi:hypothetical protein